MSRQWICTRRQWLTGLAAALGGWTSMGQVAHALGMDSQFGVAEINLETSLSRPSAWQRGLFEVQSSTSIEVNEIPSRVRLDSVDLFKHPFTILLGGDAFEPLSTTAIENLRQYLTYGGFLLIDDTSGRKNSEFMTSVERMCRRIFPNNGLSTLPTDHSVYRSFFLLESPKGRFDVSNQLRGIQLNSITPLIISSNDLSGALEVGEDGRYRNLPVPDGEFQRRECVKLFINLVLYALTSNYKHDQVHVAELLNRGGL